ncbi:MAG: DOMON-like domain-containing protein [Deltaproteobacteria bacterium]|nr:DOMON-like domain-containing protein [Deltaproteobacteria bacterium]
MSSHAFSLMPFPGNIPSFPVTISGAISRQDNFLGISYLIAGDLAGLAIPAPAPAAARHWLLWEHTCGEFFLAPEGGSGYWEFNLSPAGHWNVFRLADYRQGLEEERAITSLPLVVRHSPGVLTLSLELSLAAIIPPHQSLKAGISAVLEHLDGSFSYWALAHPGPEPDFHRREGFTISLPGTAP